MLSQQDPLLFQGFFFLNISQKTEDTHLYKRPLIMIAKHMN